MSMKDAQFIEACIPDSLRLAKHQDAELVNQAIATALLAYREADRAHVWEKNKTAAISRALSAYMESVYVPHIAKEEEDWSALQRQAEEARVMKAAQEEQSAKSAKDAYVISYTVEDSAKGDSWAEVNIPAENDSIIVYIRRGGEETTLSAVGVYKGKNGKRVYGNTVTEVIGMAVKQSGFSLVSTPDSVNPDGWRGMAPL